MISPEFVPKVQIDNIPALVQIMAWRRPGDKPLYEPMCLHQSIIWTNDGYFTDAYIHPSGLNELKDNLITTHS